jgi:hypothetical protein
MEESNTNNKRRRLSCIFMIISAMTLFLLFFGPGNRSFAARDFSTIDRESLRLFNEQKWDSVIIIGKEGFRDNMDYFYLRLRVGIAYFWLKKYIQAIEHLSKAREFNSIDPLASEYLYLSYIASGRNLDAQAMTSDMPGMIKEKLQVKQKFLDQVHFEGGYTFSSDNNKQNNPDLIGSDSIYGEQDLYGNHSYYNLDLTINLTPKINLTVAYNYLNFSKRNYFQYGYTQDQLDSTTSYWWGYMNHYSWNKHTKSYDVGYKVNQNELFLGSVFQLPAGIKLMPSFHFIYITYPETYSVYNGKTVADTILVDSITPYTGVYTFQKDSYTFQVRNSVISNYVASFTITKDFSLFTSGLSGSFSNLNNKIQTQFGWSLTWYPFGNINFYGFTNVIGFFEENESRLIVQQNIGGKILPSLWLEASAIIGDLTNANLSNGYIVYNNTDKIKYRLGASLLCPITENIDLSVIYQYFRNESIQSYSVLDPADPSQTAVKKSYQYNNYQTHTIIGGITWKF